MKKACVIGHFGFGKNLLNGQTIKTKIVTEELERQLGTSEVVKLDTHGGKKVLPKVFFAMLKQFRQCENILIFPAYNGLRVFVPLCVWMNRLFHRKLHYVVIGGWLSEFLVDKKRLQKQLKQFEGIYVETAVMQKALEQMGFENVLVIPNVKNLKILRLEELNFAVQQPYRLCTFSRVMKEKGIEDAIEAVRSVNETVGKTVYTLDIYGSVDADYKEAFAEMQKLFPAYISYRGEIDYCQSVETIRHYFALLFPTRFYTEGIPGTVIDAYASGLPVISSKWQSFEEVIEDKKTGFGYQFSDQQALVRLLEEIAEKPEMVLKLKKNCLKKAKEFTPSGGLQKLLQRIIL